MGTLEIHWLVKVVHVMTSPCTVAETITNRTITTPKIVDAIFFAVSVLAAPYPYGKAFQEKPKLYVKLMRSSDSCSSAGLTNVATSSTFIKYPQLFYVFNTYQEFSWCFALRITSFFKMKYSDYVLSWFHVKDLSIIWCLITETSHSVILWVGARVSGWMECECSNCKKLYIKITQMMVKRQLSSN